ncbi:MAG: hypothetical protein ACHQZR_09590 [Candidatus Limnocylindrales bacterium]
MGIEKAVDPGAPTARDPIAARVAVVADDLIWASRLRSAVERAGATVVTLGGLPGDPASPPPPDQLAGALVDLGLRRADGVATVAALVAAGVPVIGVGQHDDVVLRKRALAAGAGRVYSYDKLFRDGPDVVRRWLRGVADE